MTTEAYWIPTPFPGRLAILPRPRGGDWLDDEVRGWKRAGLGVVVSLLTPDEMADLDLAGEPAACEAAGVRYVSLPVPDRGVPASRAAVAELSARLAGELAAGRSVGVHCRQGIGRSAILTAGVLVAAGLDPETALRRVAEARGRPVPETPEQRRWVTAPAAHPQPI